MCVRARARARVYVCVCVCLFKTHPVSLQSCINILKTVKVEEVEPHYLFRQYSASCMTTDIFIKTCSRVGDFNSRMVNNRSQLYEPVFHLATDLVSQFALRLTLCALSRKVIEIFFRFYFVVFLSQFPNLLVKF